jgi:hypothetical protein
MQDEGTGMPLIVPMVVVPDACDAAAMRCMPPCLDAECGDDASSSDEREHNIKFPEHGKHVTDEFKLVCDTLWDLFMGYSSYGTCSHASWSA